MKLKDADKGFYQINLYEMCGVFPEYNGTWVNFYELQSDDTYMFTDRSLLKTVTNYDVKPINVEKTGHRYILKGE